MKTINIAAILLIIFATSCTRLTKNQRTEKRRMAKEKLFFLTGMAAYGVGMKVFADNCKSCK
jgi:hypothetical protein